MLPLFLERDRMEAFKLYSVSDEYIEYLRYVFPNVYSNKETTRIHTRKYVGTIVCLENYHYYIPMSSPKESDYQIAGGKKVIKKSIVPIMRIVVKNSKGLKELKGTLRISHMIPVPPSELQLYDIENEQDSTYKPPLPPPGLPLRPAPPPDGPGICRRAVWDPYLHRYPASSTHASCVPVS